MSGGGSVLVLRGEYAGQLRLEFEGGLPAGADRRIARVSVSGVGFYEDLGALPLSGADLHAVADLLAGAAVGTVGSASVGVGGGRVGVEVVDVEADTVSVAVTVSAPDHGDGGGVVLTATRLEWLCAADRWRGRGEPAGDGFAGYGLFRPRRPASFQPLLWRVASPPQGSVLNQVRPAESGAPDPGGQVGVVVGVVFTGATDATVAVDRLRYLTAGVVGDVLGTLPDGRRFAVLLLQSDPDLDAVWALEEALQPGRRGRADRRRAFYATAMAGRLAPALGDVPEAWPAGAVVLDLPALDRQLYRREGYDWPAGIGLGRGLQLLLAEVVGAQLTAMLDAYAEDLPCLYRAWPHDCQFDPVADALAAWADGALTPDLITLVQGGSAVRAEPGGPRPFELDLTPPETRSKRRKPRHPLWPPDDAAQAIRVSGSAVNDDADPDTLDEVLDMIDPLLWQQLLPDEGFDDDDG